MRKVFVNGTPPADWIAEAQAVTGRLREATPAERLQIVDDAAPLWRDDRIRNWLLSQFFNKCWYTEAKDSVSAYHVDHYRPKGRVKDLNGNESDGYWWLAFEWTNYRICGQLINVKKLDVFPIVEGPRANPDYAGSLMLEAPLLIDPVTENARLISYEADEDACIATPANGIEGTDEQRARATIEVLGLNIRARLNSKRRDYWDKCMLAIADYQSAAGPDALRRISQANAVRKLREMIAYKEEFSSVVEACIQKRAPLPLLASVFEHQPYV